MSASGKIFSEKKGSKEFVTSLIDIAFEEAKTFNRFNSFFRECPILSDKKFLKITIERVLGKHDSGREFLQELNWNLMSNLSNSTYFDALKSKRRANVVAQISQFAFNRVQETANEAGIDYLKDFPEFDDFSVLNGDGHFIAHCGHTKSDNGKTYAAGSIYTQDKRNGLIFPLCTVSDGSGKNHEMPIFKKIVGQMPSNHFGRKKTLWVNDRGYLNHGWWEKQKRRGHFFITRLKSNSMGLKCGDIAFDRNDEFNKGVVGYYSIGFTSNQGCLSVVEILNPETEELFRFVTTLPTHIRPGVIAWLFFKRWDVEKSFDNFKNDLKQNKAWATEIPAIKIQSHAIIFVYNIIRLIHEKVILSKKTENNNAETISERKYKIQLCKRDKEKPNSSP